MFGRRRNPPAKLRPALDKGERVLAWARGSDGDGVVVATTVGLWLPGRARLGWHQIHKATWSGSQLTVIPALVLADREAPDGTAYTVMTDDAALSVNLTEPGEVPGIVRQRVTKSVAYTVHHPFPVGGARVVARRPGGANGLAWHVRYDDGTEVDDPTVVAVTGELVAEAAAPTQPD